MGLIVKTDTDTAWDAIVEQTEGDEDMAQSVADSMVSDKEKALHDVENAEIAQSGSVADKIAAKQHKQNVDNAKAELEHWKEIAGTLERRKLSAEQSDEDSNAPQNDNVPKEQNDAEPQIGNINVPQSDEAPIERQLYLNLQETYLLFPCYRVSQLMHRIYHDLS